MKCNVCGNDYPSQGYFAVPGICDSCFKKMPIEQQNQIIAQAYNYDSFEEMTISERRVGFGRRLGALALDVLFCVIIYLTIFFLSGMYESQMLVAEKVRSQGLNFQLITQVGYEFIEQNMTTLLFMQFMFLLYFSLEVIVGATLGKVIVGIQVANEDGKPAKFIQLLSRFAYKYSAQIISIFTVVYYRSTMLSLVQNLFYLTVIVGCFFALSKTKLALHDRIFKTAVFKKSELDQKQSTNELN